MTAIELAANYHDRVQKLILASAISKKWLNKDEKIYKTAQVIFNLKIERVVWSMVRLFSKILPGMIANSFYPQFSNYPSHKLSPKDILELVSAMKHYRSKKGFLNDIDQDISDEAIKNVQCQTLVIHSNYDNSVPFEYAIHSNNTIQNSRLIELDNE